MQLHDINARRQLAFEHIDELARDWRRAQKASAAELRHSEQAEHATPASLLNRLRRRRPARAAAQRP
jgi:hypothetical protein